MAWTGPRPDLFADPAVARLAVEHAAREVVERDRQSDRAGRRVRFLVGGQRGVDTWAAGAAQTLGLSYTLILPLPPVNFVEPDWTAEERALLEQGVALAEEVVIVGGQREEAYTARNRRLAEGAELLIAVWTGQLGGGTAETMRLARQAGREVHEIVLPASRTADQARGRGV